MNILIVDDAPTNLKLLRVQLEGEGHAITEARDGREALQTLAQQKFDAIISDILMPRMDGYQLCQEVRASETLRGMPFIFYTSTYTSPADERFGLELGADKFIRKPASVKEMLAALDEATRLPARSRSRPVIRPEEMTVMKEYNDRLVAKLEQKNLDLANQNRRLLEAQGQLQKQAIALETAASGILITDLRGVIEWVNPAFEAVTGYSASEVLGKTPRILKSGAHNPAFYSEFWRTISNGKVWRGEFINRRKDGTLSHDQHTVSPVRSPNGKITHYVGVMHDITERRRTEEALRSSHAELQQLLAHSPAVLYRLKIENGGETIIPTMVSENMSRLLGFAVSEVLTFEWWASHVHPDDYPSVREKFREVLSSGADRSEYRIRHKDGTFRWIEDNRRVITDREGLGAELIGVWTDITERKASEDALRASQERFEQMAAQVADVFWMATKDHSQVLYLSPAYERIWKRPCQEVYDCPSSFLESVLPADRERIRVAMAQQIQGKETKTEYRISRPDGSIRWIRGRVFPVKNEAGEFYRIAGVAEDITERKQLEAELRQSQKLEAMGTLAGGIAHDFNNILSAINGFAELARMDSQDRPTVLEYLRETLKAGQRAAELVKQILAFSRRQEQERKPVQLRHILLEALKLLRATVPSTIHFESMLAKDAPVVLADVTQIHQVIMNLGTNAWHAMRERPGKLEIRLERFHVTEDFAAIHPGLRPADYARITISDTGIGMDALVLDRIFEPFFTTKPQGEGTGLGLAVVHGIMKAHDGLTTVYSQPGLGTTFHLYFPAYASETSEQAKIETAPSPGRGERIAVVDDEEPLVRLTCRLLQKLGYQAEAWTKPAELLQEIRANPGKFDLLLTDLTMPEMIGTTLATKVLQIRPDLPIILTSGFTGSLTEDQLRAIGIRELVMKPPTAGSLGNALDSALRERRAQRNSPAQS